MRLDKNKTLISMTKIANTVVGVRLLGIYPTCHINKATKHKTHLAYTNRHAIR